MRLCMFHPAGRTLERGWVGRIEDDRVLHLAAQTLQHFFTGGSSARVHAEYPLDEVVLLAPVPVPPSVRTFEPDGSFAFANPAAIVGPGGVVTAPPSARALSVLPRVAAVIGGAEEIGGYLLVLELRAPGLPLPKDRDFALGCCPFVVAAETVRRSMRSVRLEADGHPASPLDLTGYDFAAARALAASGTVLRAGDLLCAPAVGELDVAHALAADAGAFGSSSYVIQSPAG